MYTVNYTNFFDFGVDAGDAQLEGFYALLGLPVPIRFFERQEYILSVSQLCILSPAFYNDVKCCFIIKMCSLSEVIQ